MSNHYLTFIVTIQARDLNRLKEFYTWLSRANKEMSYKHLNNNKETYERLVKTESDLLELITQSTISDFKFNAYILKMIIVKLELIQSELIIGVNLSSNHIYEILNANRLFMNKLLDELISPF